MTIKVSDSQLYLLTEAVKDKLKEARSEAEDYFYTSAPDRSGDWADLYRLLRSIDKHQEKQRPKIHRGRNLRRFFKRFKRQVQRLNSQRASTIINTPSRWDYLKHALTGWMSK
jgi:hypothetical protein